MAAWTADPTLFNVRSPSQYCDSSCCSRGDVQPFVALGQALQKHGHRVRLATHAAFGQFVKKAGLGFYTIGGDPAELMSYMVRNPGLIPSMKSLRAGDIQKKRASMAEILRGCWESCLEPDQDEKKPFVADAIIANPPSFAHVHCAQALGIPVHLMFTMPWTSTRAVHHPLANLKYSGNDPSLGNLISYHFVEWLTWQGLGDLINAWRKDSLNLDPIPVTEGPNLLETLNVPFTYYVCDFFFRDTVSYTPAADLESFLHAGTPPVYIGFGSIILEDVESTMSIILEAIERTGVRAIIAGGWSDLRGDGSPHVHYVRDCPHEWLFQHVAAVVHHGGAGTTACGLRNGKPTTIIPFFGDQPFWGNMVATTGAGPEPIPYKDLTAANLADAIAFCLTPHAAAVAQFIAESIHQEPGVDAAVKSFHAHLPKHRMACDILKGELAVWKITRYGRLIKLSAAAALILKREGHVQEKDVSPYQSKPFTISIRRWEPFTAISSASFSAITGMADATTGVFIEPYKEYKRLRSSGRQETSALVSSSPWTIPESSLVTQAVTSAAPASSSVIMPSTESKEPAYAKRMALASATSLGKFLGRSSRGAFVDLPLATVEGLRAVPGLYGEEVSMHAPVLDWRTGVHVGWSTFTHGMYEGFTDIFVHTYQGKKNQGALGVAKGLTKGLASLTLKTGAASIGLVAYPNQGIYRSLRTSIRKGHAKQIDEARWAESVWISSVEGRMQVDVAQICSLYEGLLASREKRHRRGHRLFS
ncbi:UDP-Glycosyltransferase [Aspergillus nanangensis]|uniref:UDP-Glycosyltransferase n=1 Tax=Aspergillus nanangensis TaxID=2582783 RepID=A0AAD4CBY7_ASPNN|nr:UDP-Glycosyltransferase [Aspergillus nanangensis]